MGSTQDFEWWCPHSYLCELGTLRTLGRRALLPAYVGGPGRRSTAAADAPRGHFASASGAEHFDPKGARGKRETAVVRRQDERTLRVLTPHQGRREVKRAPRAERHGEGLGGA